VAGQVPLVAVHSAPSVTTLRPSPLVLRASAAPGGCTGRPTRALIFAWTLTAGFAPGADAMPETAQGVKTKVAPAGCWALCILLCLSAEQNVLGETLFVPCGSSS
jgi:hypothetical protein